MYIYILNLYIWRNTRSTIKNEKLETGSISNHFSPHCLRHLCTQKISGEIPLQAKLNCQLTVVRHRDQLHSCFKARTRPRCTPRKPSFRFPVVNLRGSKRSDSKIVSSGRLARLSARLSTRRFQSPSLTTLTFDTVAR